MLMRKTVICLVLCAAIGMTSGLGAVSAGAEEPPPSGGGQPELPPLPTVPGPNGEPVQVQGAVESVVGATAPVTEAAKPVTGGGSRPAPPVGGSSGGSGHHEAPDPVGKVVAGASKAATGAATAATATVESATGSTAKKPSPPPAPTAAPPTTTAPETTTVPAATASASPESAVPTESGGANPSPPGASAPHRSATPAAHSDPSVPQARQIAHPFESSPAAAPSLSAGAIATVAGSVRSAFGTSSGSPADPGTSGDTAAVSELPPANDAQHSFQLSDLTPGHPLGTVLFLLVLGAGALALTLVMRRELGLAAIRLPRRR